MHCNNCSYSSVQSAHNVYTNTETDSGIQSELNGILTDLIARVQQRDHNVLIIIEKEINNRPPGMFGTK